VQKVVQNTLRNQKLPAEIIPNYIPQMVQDMVTERAMAYEAERLGFQVNDQDVRDAIKQMAPSLFPDGNFVGRTPTRRCWRNKISPSRFEESLRAAPDQQAAQTSRWKARCFAGRDRTGIQEEVRKDQGAVGADQVRYVCQGIRTHGRGPERNTTMRTNRLSDAGEEEPAVLIRPTNQAGAAVKFSDAELQSAYNQIKDQYV